MMLGRPFSMLFFMGLLFWVFSILVKTDPGDRIVSACKPIEFAGSLTGNLLDLGSLEAGNGARKAFKAIEGSCQIVFSRQFYSEVVLDERHEAINESPASNNAEKKEKISDLLGI